tara:strand:- start:3758 stop:5008 length:1251 start_codon:yes stop_codon:yes gene_type:complete
MGIQGQQDARPSVVVAEIDGVIHPVTAEFVDDALARAVEINAEAIVIVLRTPGGLVDSTRTIVSRMIESQAPIVVFVGPSGARAASAGFILTLAADVAAMAPGTHIGAAHPVSGTGQQLDETSSKKAEEDIAAYVRSLAEARNRNVLLSEEAVTESRAFTDSEALGATPPLIDMVVENIETLLQELDGMKIHRFNGKEVTLKTANAQTVYVEMTWRQELLSTIAHPQIAYLLLTLGMLGLTVELWNPGAIVPGFAGAMALLLAFFAFQVLTVNTTGLLLILLGIGLLAGEIFAPSFGVLGITGTISLLAGSIMLTSDIPGVSVGLGFIIPVVLTLAGITLFLGRLAISAQRTPSTTGPEGLVGIEGQTLTAVSANSPGQVKLRGEIWNATCQDTIAPGSTVRVVAANNLSVQVIKV